jgi:uncharacterized protein (TIGR03382 family)
VLKQRHCGQTGSARANVQTYRPGATLHLVWDEYVVHPGWFRISFQQNGDTFEVPPASGAASNYPTEDLTGKTDPATGSLIIADRIMHGTSSFDVTLPNVECNNCTLQLTQMMTDKPPYTADTTSDDIYYQCVDLVLTASAPPSDAGGGGGDTAGTSGGCSTSGGAPGLLLVAALGLVRRRRPRR